MKIGVIVAIALGGMLPLAWAGAEPGASAGDWSEYLFSGAHSSFNATATAISQSNIGDLNPVWQWVDPPRTHGGSTLLQASPTVVGGVMYIGDGDGRFFAINESTQSVLWSQYVGWDKGTTCGNGGGIISTAAVVPDPSTGTLAVYVDAPDGYLYAFNAATGSILWKSQVDIPSTRVNNYYSWGSPLVANGKVYIGISSFCDSPLVPAGLKAYTQSTGSLVAFWHSLPDNEDGASIWSSAGLTPSGDIIVTTGNAKNTKQPEWANSVVRLNGSSLAFEGGWEVPKTQQVFDSDFGGSPTMFTATLDDVDTPMVGACNKNGTYYAFRQSNVGAGPVWEYQLADPSSTGPGECDASAIWNGTQLIVAGGNTTDISNVSYNGSVQSLNPATGVPLWQTGLPGGIIGSPTMDGNGVIAAQVHWSTTTTYGVFLLSAQSGAVLGEIPTYHAMFSQPVFANNDMLVVAGNSVTAYAVTTEGAPIATVTPPAIVSGTPTTVRIYGSGFVKGARVYIEGDVTVGSVEVVSSTEIVATLRATTNSLTGPRDVTVMNGSVASRCSSCLEVVHLSHVTVTSSIDPSAYDQPVALTATVTPTDGGGSIKFLDDGSSIFGCSAQSLSMTGPTSAKATCTTSTLPIGINSIEAVYSGDTRYGRSKAVLGGGETIYLPPPSTLTATAQSTKKIKLTWDSVPGATRYFVFKATSSTGPFTKIETTTSTTWTEGGLNSGTTYYYKVRASAPTGVSGFSNVVSAAPGGGQP